MENRKYKNSEEVTRQLRELVRRRLCFGESDLPSERQLAVEFRANRATMRKAVAALAEEGLLRREGRCTRLVRPFHDFGPCGRILFLASGIHSAFQETAMERLWQALQVALLRNRADVQLLLTEPETTIDQIRTTLSAADTVLLVNCGGNCAADVVSMLKEGGRKKTVFALLESEVFDFPNLIALDNYAVGAIAAEALIDAGCRKPFALWEICPNRDFARRAQGFADKLDAHNLGGIQSVFWLPHESGSIGEKYINFIDWAVTRGYDGLFLMSDESVGELARHGFSTGLIPERLKLITVDATRASFRHTPPVSCVSHATSQMVTEIVGQLQLIAENNFRPVRKLVRPTLYENGTL